MPCICIDEGYTISQAHVNAFAMFDAFTDK